MKIKSIIFGLFSIIVCSCTSPRYLTSSDRIDVNEYGSHIKIDHKSLSSIEGELIAIDSNTIVILQETSMNKCTIFKTEDIKKFKLRYAKPKHYGWTIPVYTLATISHGVFLLLTAPLNLIVTTAVTIGGERAFTYDNDDLTYEELKIFARFPQGIPCNVDIKDIRLSLPPTKRAK